MAVSVQPQTAQAQGLREAGASLLLPTTGQALNGEIRSRKTKVMGAIEVASVTTAVVLGTTVSGGLVWIGLGPMLANRVWSASDAYKVARRNPQQEPMMQTQVDDAQRTLEYSRQRRFDREQAQRSDLRDRMRQAAELGYAS
ncbi:MAG: hypothetical protein FGM27_00215 [Candidatus Omnitrophica bacterium]|nr:hypothetical protein [Candidatus Omnitrophota bacterium]